MIAVDTNLLVYSHRLDMPLHMQAQEPLRHLVEGGTAWAIPWPCAHEFLAVVTNPRIFKEPTPVRLAFAYLQTLAASSELHWIAEGPGYLDKLQAVLQPGNIVGGRIHDARIAALCLYHGIDELWTADRDFSFFPQLKTRNPLAKQ